jgi:hypothetical protein
MKYEFYKKKDTKGFWSWLCNLIKPYTMLYCSDFENSKDSDRLLLCGDKHKLFKEIKP